MRNVTENEKRSTDIRGRLTATELERDMLERGYVTVRMLARKFGMHYATMHLHVRTDLEQARPVFKIVQGPRNQRFVSLASVKRWLERFTPPAALGGLNKIDLDDWSDVVKY